MCLTTKNIGERIGKATKLLAGSFLLFTIFSCQPSELTEEQPADLISETNSGLNESLSGKDESFSNSLTDLDVNEDFTNLKFVGDFELINVYGRFADGSIEDITSQASFIVRPSYIGKVISTEPVRFEALSQGQGEIIASVGSRDISIPMTVITNSISAIVIETAGIVLGATSQLKALAIFEDGSQLDVSDDVNWSSTDADMVTITQNPTFITPTLLGNSLITASYEGYTGSQFISVTKSDISSIKLTPYQETSDLKGVVQVGKTGNMKLEAIFNDGSIEDYTEHARWSANSPKITVSMDVGRRGEVKGVTPGTTEVTASLGGFTATAEMLVASGCVSIDLLPDPNNTDTIEAYNSIDLPLQVTCEFSNGQILDVSDLATFTFNHSTYATIGMMDTEVKDEDGNITIENKLILRPTEKSYDTNIPLDIPLSGTVEIPGFSLDFDVRIYDKPVTAIQIVDVPGTAIECNTAKFTQIKAMGTFGSGANATIADITNLVSWTSSSNALTVGNTKDLDKGQLITNTANRTDIEISLDYESIDGTVFHETATVDIGPAELVDLDMRIYSTKITDPFNEADAITGTVSMPLGKKMPFRVFGIMGCGPDKDYTPFNSINYTTPNEIIVDKSNPAHAMVDTITGVSQLKADTEHNSVTIETTRNVEPGPREIYEIEISTTAPETTVDGGPIGIIYWVDTNQTVTNVATSLFTNYRSIDGCTFGTNCQDISSASALADGAGVHTTTITWSVDDTSVATIDPATGELNPVKEGIVEVSASAAVDYIDAGRTDTSIVQNDTFKIGIKTPCTDVVDTSASYNHYCYYLGAKNQSCTDICGAGKVNTDGNNYLYGTGARSQCEAVLSKIIGSAITLSETEPPYALGCVKGDSFSYMAINGGFDPNMASTNIQRVCACNP